MKILTLINKTFQKFIDWYLPGPVVINPMIIGVELSDKEILAKAVKAFELKKKGLAR